MMDKKILSGILLSFFFVMTYFVMIPDTMALSSSDLGADNIGQNTGLADKDPRETVAGIIKVVMTFLAIISVVIILLGGFKWMTATGNEDQVGEAKKIITQGIIGLIIVLSAWGIAKFLLDKALEATS